MRAKKTHPGHVKTRLYSEIEKALRSGAGEIVLSLPDSPIKRKKVVAMHVLGDRILFFDPDRNPELSYTVECGVAGDSCPDYPGMKYEGRGLHSLPTRFLRDLFLDGKAYALVPVSHRLQLAV